NLAHSASLHSKEKIAPSKPGIKHLGRLGELTVSDARSKATDYAVAARHGRDIVAEHKAIRQPGLSLGDAYLAYTEALNRRGASPNTLKLNARNWSFYLSPYQARELSSISKRDVRDWHAKWGESGPTVANKAARLLRAIFNYAQKKLTDELIANPCCAFEFFQERGLRRLIPTAGLGDWWKRVESIPNPIRRGYWTFLLFTGLRKEDAATLKWQDVHECHIHRPNPKGGRTKAFDVPITAQVAELLAEVKAAGARLHPNSPYVFPSGAARGYVTNAREDAHIPNCSPHDVRRTYATACVEAGIDPYTVKALLNHAPDLSDVTARYVLPTGARKAEAAQKVADYLTSQIENAKNAQPLVA
ncbi:MAG: tyrosine-type recombinase/integrase, partial [Hyphomicrobiales bacterium]|nr:tyrosine-type recombinase/integrase [Hyphomicrobiales bacterium]